MNRFKFEAMFNEFPFLEEVTGTSVERADCTICDGIIVKRFNKELLAYVPVYRGATGNKVGIRDGKEISFVLNSGEVISDTVICAGSVIHNEAHTENEFWEGETVLEAIFEQNVAEYLSYIVLFEYGYVIRDHYSLDNWRVTVYKPARGVDAVALVREAQEQAAALVAAEVDF